MLWRTWEVAQGDHVVACAKVAPGEMTYEQRSWVTMLWRARKDAQGD